MPVPDFSPGEVLTAANMNQVGMWKITPTVSGTGVTVGSNGDVILTAAPDPFITCFSNKFRNYRIICQLTGFSGPAAAVVWRPANGTTPNTTAANYFNSGADQPYSGGAVGPVSNNGAFAQHNISRVNGGNDFSNFIADIMAPFSSTERTCYASTYRDTGFYGWHGGALSVTTSYNTFNLRTNGTNTMTGRISIYGYN